MYTFLAIAPCNFTVNGKHYSAEAGTPIQVEYNEALIMSSPTFRYRSYLRVITPIQPPTDSSAQLSSTITLTEPVEEPVTKPVEEPVTKPVEEPVTKPVEEPVVEPEVKTNRRSKSKKESVFSADLKESEGETQINTEVINLF